MSSAPRTLQKGAGALPIHFASASMLTREMYSFALNPCVLGSRQACLDAHDFARIKDGSPFVARRLKQALEAQKSWYTPLVRPDKIQI